MALQILRDFRGLKVLVVHPPDPDGVGLVEHLGRIGCAVETVWPVPDAFPRGADIVLLAFDHEQRPAIARLLKSCDEERMPTLIAVVAYENPATLQMVIESGALAIVERPVRPFGLLTNLVLARSLWLERQKAVRRVRKLERKVAGIQNIQKAKTILMAAQGIDEDGAYQSIRRQAMAKRLSMEEVAAAIINANELLTARPPDA
jgi:AmiR/NasT family two-component response regulator